MQQILQGIEHLSETVGQFHCRHIMLVSDASYSYLELKKQVEALEIPKRFFPNSLPTPYRSRLTMAPNYFLPQDVTPLSLSEEVVALMSPSA